MVRFRKNKSEKSWPLGQDFFVTFRRLGKESYKQKNLHRLIGSLFTEKTSKEGFFIEVSSHKRERVVAIYRSSLRLS